jgi:putative component of membrane protein insertase Oxa1/YidC/SpoIIIJ protein YidD
VRIVVILIPLFLILFLGYAYPENLLRGPFSCSHQVPEQKTDKTTSSGNLIESFLSAQLKIYQNFMSPYWGNDCSHYPSCSNYSLLAIKKHGGVLGFIMTFDRLQHESNEAKYSPLIKIGSETKVYDPIENNDFWWYEE